MSSHPTNLTLFRAWAKAMEAGATVDKPNYGKGQKVSMTSRNSKPARKAKTSRRRNRRRKRRSLRRSMRIQNG